MVVVLKGPDTNIWHILEMLWHYGGESQDWGSPSFSSPRCYSTEVRRISIFMPQSLEWKSVLIVVLVNNHHLFYFFQGIIITPLLLLLFVSILMLSLISLIVTIYNPLRGVIRIKLKFESFCVTLHHI